MSFVPVEGARPGVGQGVGSDKDTVEEEEEEEDPSQIPDPDLGDLPTPTKPGKAQLLLHESCIRPCLAGGGSAQGQHG